MLPPVIPKPKHHKKREEELATVVRDKGSSTFLSCHCSQDVVCIMILQGECFDPAQFRQVCDEEINVKAIQRFKKKIPVALGT